MAVLTQLGAWAGALLAIAALVTLVVRSRLVRWLWKRIVFEPITAWHRAQTDYVTEPKIAELRAQFVPNGGTSLRDRVNNLEVGVAAIETRLARWEQQGSASS